MEIGAAAGQERQKAEIGEGAQESERAEMGWVEREWERWKEFEKTVLCKTVLSGKRLGQMNWDCLPRC
jgi:hypothetical protein